MKSADALREIGAEPDVPLAEYTWVKVGGPAEWFFTAQNSEDLRTALLLARAREMPVTLIGGGANVLVADEGVAGLVIRLNGDLRKIVEAGPGLVRAGAGAKIIDLTKAYQTAHRTGLEWSIGIPGTVGGAIFMNAGIPDGCTADAVVEVEAVSASGEMTTVNRAGCGFSYRVSRFQTSGETILSATFRLGDAPWDKARAKAYTEYRTTRQPYDLPNFGSVFRNPSGDHAARLIESVGLKGHRIGGAGFSEKHANFIVNYGNAKAADVRSLIRLAQERVREAKGVALETEVRTLGRHPVPA